MSCGGITAGTPENPGRYPGEAFSYPEEAFEDKPYVAALPARSVRHITLHGLSPSPRDGRYVAFDSDADNLVSTPADLGPPGTRHIYRAPVLW